MIDPQNIRLVFQALAEYLSSELGQTVECVLADEVESKPDYPFAQFKILSQRRKGEHSKGVTISGIEGDSEHALQTEYLNLDAPISVTICHSASESVWGIASLALDWFDSEAGRIACSEQNVHARLLNQSVQDRTTLIELSYEYRAGFDVQFETVRESETIVEAVNIEATASGIILEKV